MTLHVDLRSTLTAVRASCGADEARPPLPRREFVLAFHITEVRLNKLQEGIRTRSEPAEPNRTEPDRATTCPKNADRTASNQENYNSEPNRNESINFRKVRNRNESNRTGSFLLHLMEVWLNMLRHGACYGSSPSPTLVKHAKAFP